MLWTSNVRPTKQMGWQHFKAAPPQTSPYRRSSEAPPATRYSRLYFCGCHGRLGKFLGLQIPCKFGGSILAIARLQRSANSVLCRSPHSHVIGRLRFTEAAKTDNYPYISMATAGALVSVITQLNRGNQEYLVQPSSSSTLTDMRAHPTVLVGTYDNKWTVLLSKDLRFRFSSKPLSEITDSRNPSRVWRRAEGLPYKDKDDYAIVARFHDKVTDNLMVIIAGLGKNGTAAAAQFATTSRDLDLLNASSAKGWESRNVEIALKTAVVDSKIGASTIEAVEVW